MPHTGHEPQQGGRRGSRVLSLLGQGVLVVAALACALMGASGAFSSSDDPTDPTDPTGLIHGLGITQILLALGAIALAIQPRSRRSVLGAVGVLACSFLAGLLWLWVLIATSG